MGLGARVEFGVGVWVGVRVGVGVGVRPAPLPVALPSAYVALPSSPDPGRASAHGDARSAGSARL